ncbi:MAG: hypothetical protein ACI8VZ_002214 [Candidatus Paceibacteria bacterium]
MSRSRINHKKVDMQASFKNEARFFFGVKRSLSFYGFQSGALQEGHSKNFLYFNTISIHYFIFIFI